MAHPRTACDIDPVAARAGFCLSPLRVKEDWRKVYKSVHPVMPLLRDQF